MADETDDEGFAAQPLARMPSGIAGLDEVLRGGFIRNGIYIVQGTPGAGKTIFGNQLCHSHVGAGGRALYVTLLSEQHDRMLANIRGMSFFQGRRIAHELFYVSAFRVLEREGLQGLLGLLRREIVTRGATVLVIDGLLAAEHMAPSELEVKKFVHELQIQAATGDCTMFLLTSALDATVSPEHTMVDGMIEIADQQYGWRAERDLLVRKFRGGPYLRGRHAMEITDDGIVVYPRTEVRLARPSRTEPRRGDRVSSGSDGLDAMLGGGLPRGSSTLVLGPTGSGKSTLGMNFLARSTPGEPGLMVGFYETPEHVCERAEGVAPALPQLMREKVVELVWPLETEDMIDRVAVELLENVSRRGVRRLLVDGLIGFHNMAVRPERVPQFFRALSGEMRAIGVTAVFTMEVPEASSMAVSTPVTNVTPIADNVVLLRYIEHAGRLTRLASVLKLRDSAFDERLRIFRIDETGIAVGDGFTQTAATPGALYGATGSGQGAPGEA